MNIYKKFEKICKVLNNNCNREEKLSFFISNLLVDAQKIKLSKDVILCGATPFAKKVLANRELLFADDVNLIIEDFDDLYSNVCSGGCLYYAHALILVNI